MKTRSLLIFIFAILFSLNLISAINLNVKVTPISNTVIPELNKPAVFNITITNFGESDSFQIYSLVGIDITPKNITIPAGETKTIEIQVMPQYSMISKRELMILEYKIKDSKNEIKKGELTINIADLSHCFIIEPKDIDINSEKLTIVIKNKVMYEFLELKINFNSPFLDYTTALTLNPLETREIEIPINLDKLKTIEAGNYIIKTEITTQGKKGFYTPTVKYLEQEDIQTTEKGSGILINQKEITKKNNGNVKTKVQFVIQKNIFTYFFTTVGEYTTETKIEGLKYYYIWTKELGPNEEYTVSTTSNWLYPIAIIILIVIVVIIIKRFLELDLILRKDVSFVRTKGGEFALKVGIRIRAKKFIENIRVVDRLPLLVHLYEKFGAIHPDRFDEKNKKLEWNVDSLAKGEERIFTYIIYSKIGVVGRFELPYARASYDKEGQRKHVLSNRAFYVNKVKKKKFEEWE